MIRLPVVGSEEPALIDDMHAGLLGYRWRFDRDGYVMRKTKGRRVYLHHAVMGSAPSGDFVRDHINRNKLDNTGTNLRWVARADNNRNRSASSRNATGIRGVRFDAVSGRFLARLQSGGRTLARGWFNDADQADAFLIGERRRLMPASYEAA